MLNKKAFTLMELLLVVAILAIIAAAAAPLYTQGTREALDEAEKSNFLSAYENTVTGANLMLAMLLTNNSKTSSTDGQDATLKGKFLPTGISLDMLNQWKIGPNKAVRNLNYYIPVTSRLFYSKKRTPFFISAKIGDNQDIILYYVKVYNNNLKDYHGAANKDKTDATHEIHLTKEKNLDYYWKEIREL